MSKPDGYYLCWFDDRAAVTVAAKLAAACDAYRARFGTAPSVALVHESELPQAAAPDGVQVRAASFVRCCNYWVGRE